MDLLVTGGRVTSVSWGESWTGESIGLWHAKEGKGGDDKMAKKSRGGRMTAAKKRAKKAPGGKGRVKRRKAGRKIMKT